MYKVICEFEVPDDEDFAEVHAALEAAIPDSAINLNIIDEDIQESEDV